jgi:hypothetical protein
MRWMSVDPGGTTGYALWEGRELVDQGSVRCGDTYEKQEVGVRALVLVWLGHCDLDSVLLIEDFLLRPGGVRSSKREGLAPVQVSGLLYATLRERGWTGERYSYLASESKLVITDHRLRAKGMWRGNDHARDAIRQGLLFLRKKPSFERS